MIDLVGPVLRDSFLYLCKFDLPLKLQKVLDEVIELCDCDSRQKSRVLDWLTDAALFGERNGLGNFIPSTN